ncbi:MAG: hypothetical protein GF313_04225 [Caldithrix sp.]|nr:hypothetical protein [Caldithrix sp.]
MHIAERYTAKDTELTNRLAYQRRSNASILNLISEPALFPERVELLPFLKSSLQFIDIDPESFQLQVNNSITHLEIDVELFSKAVNELIINALQAVNNDLDLVQIVIDLIPGGSPLTNLNWIRFTIADSGGGLDDDYYLLMKEPFFTTHKENGSPGFGINIAENIIHAHNGTLEIKSRADKGTEAIIYIPDRQKHE